MKTIFKALFLFITIGISAQQSATESEVVTKALKEKEALTKTSIIKNLSFTNIGPTVMSGRVADMAVNPEDPTEFYVGYASGGLWYTNNNGASFTPLLDNSPTQNVGDIAVDWNNRTIWVGTGEKNSSRSSYAGIGMLKSNNQGKTWEHVGLSDSHHVSRIVINSENPEEVVVGVIGHLYTPNKERGVFKTIDGGKTWKKTLFINNDTGIIDVVAAPENPNVLYAASWERERKAWNFDGDGNNSAIYKSTDGGDTWGNISSNNGFRNGAGVGRIGLSIYDENTVYALHDSQFRRASKEKKNQASNGLTKEGFKKMSKDQFLKLTDKKLNNYLKANRFQEKYSAVSVKKMVRSGAVKPIDLAKYVENANTLLFDTPVEGAEVFVTTNGGKNWNKTHKNHIDGLYSSYGYYFGEIRVDPQDKNAIYVLGVPILKSKDGGKTFTSIGKENVHSDHQALWVNPKRKGHLVEGNDGGLNISYDDGEHWVKLNSPSVGQFYAIYADNQTPYNVYGGLQDNGVWTASHNAKMNNRWHQTGKNPYTSIMGGDGMQVQVDDRNPSIVYTGSQFGNYFRLNRDKGERTYIQPKHTLGEAPYRFNWQTPIHLSRHNQDILYLGGNKLHRSLNQGDTWETISDDLTTGGKKGNVAYGTLTTISESPFQFGLLYVGSDDGYVHLSKNGGGSWERVSNSFPKELWVSRVIASKHKKERVYVTLNGYRSDDFTVYIYVSNDYGKTWENISNNIPTSPVNVIREDSENPDLLYVGTDNGAYASFNQGKEWSPFQKGLPNVAIHDLVIQPTAKHLILGTHGRSLYKATIASLQSMTSEIIAKESHIFSISNIKKDRRWGNSWGRWSSPFIPKISIPYYLNSSKKVTINIYKDELLVASIVKDSDKGFNEASFDLSFSEKGRKAYLKKVKDQSLKAAKNGTYFLPKGVYTVKIASSTEVFEIQ
ncbi:glycosyl hydrolase [Flavobacteriaceae bacterium]|nr:glycosyl hydrolase [Flavobacteriaceae bacterium]MDA9773155.1 glycosyl hydrolase [Flavobacteriaceae bacterium]MDB4064632.1 glycosyl hydrolase [Flavobacteriaceae bacterium]